jgi:hypothetical protein
MSDAWAPSLSPAEFILKCSFHIETYPGLASGRPRAIVRKTGRSIRSPRAHSLPLSRA